MTKVIDFKPKTDLPPGVQSDVAELCDRILAAKIALNNGKNHLLQLEAQLTELVGVKEEGAFSVAVDDRFKVTTTGKVNRTLDPDKVESVRQHVAPELFDQLFSYRPALNMKTYRALPGVNDEALAAVNYALTSKPGKASIKIEPLTGE